MTRGTRPLQPSGFARGKGVDVADLVVVDDENGSYVYAVIEETGEPRSTCSRRCSRD